MPLQATSGVATYDAFGGGVPVAANYIEDMFQTWLYTGNGSTQPITNGIDLAGEGGLVWLKRRDGAVSHILFDTARSTGSGDPFLQTNTTDAQVGPTTNYLSYLSNGFNLDSAASGINGSGDTQVSWTFRKQPKFFDVVTWSGNGANDRKIAHSLGSVPGCIMVKRTDTTGNWQVYHRSAAEDPSIALLVLNSPNAVVSDGNVWWSTPPTSTEFTVGGVANVNASGGTYVAYLFAHDAGGFGLSGTDNVISCGSFTTDASGLATVNLGYEPQLLLYKRTDGVGNWNIVDNMRGWAVGGNSQRLQANTADAEQTSGGGVTSPTSTGFTVNGGIPASATAIYIAIRRGPMKTPTTGTSVFDPELTAAATGTTVTTNFPIDLQLYRATGVLDNTYVVDRLRGVNTTAVNTSTPRLFTSTTGAESTDAVTRAWDNTGFQTPLSNGGVSSIYWNFRRAPGFFDEVCYTGTGAATRTLNHNLGVSPELVIIKARSNTANWTVWNSKTANGVMILNGNDALDTSVSEVGNPTSTTFDVKFNGSSTYDSNWSGYTYVAYLFASAPGVSKVGSYTGTGTTQTINCGFTAGARFVLIKRTDSTGDWYVWDSARGIVAGNDPYLLLNSTAAEVTSTDYVDTAATGFELSSTAPAAINASGGTFIFLAIA